MFFMFEISKIICFSNLLKFGVALHVQARQLKNTAKVFLRLCFFAGSFVQPFLQTVKNARQVKQQKKKWAKFEVLALTRTGETGRWATTAIADRDGDAWVVVAGRGHES